MVLMRKIFCVKFLSFITMEFNVVCERSLIIAIETDQECIQEY